MSKPPKVVHSYCANVDEYCCNRIEWVGGIIFDFQYKMSFSIRMRRVPPPSVFLYASPFKFFSRVELELCLLSENVKILIKW